MAAVKKYKLKTHKGAKRRFQVTGSGRLLRMKGGASHLRRRKSRRSKRLYHQKVAVHPLDAPRLRRLLSRGGRG